MQCVHQGFTVDVIVRHLQSPQVYVHQIGLIVPRSVDSSSNVLTPFNSSSSKSSPPQHTTNMRPRIFSCALCGWAIVDQPGAVSWLNQFRGLFPGPTGIVLTGVGLYDDPGRGAFIAPVDRNSRWDDLGYDSPEEDQFGAMNQGEVNGRHGLFPWETVLRTESIWSLILFSVQTPNQRILVASL
ncbi:hypothetical protein BX600DRAFT_2895 [Xylariales sp. PMI_506]|nr:hypothetical protein BX600DRAFT_2895 [Xylariales sp. PMI_506]